VRESVARSQAREAGRPVPGVQKQAAR
jgi:hypothetical protein